MRSFSRLELSLLEEPDNTSLVPEITRCELWACTSPTPTRCICCNRRVCDAHSTVELMNMTLQIEGAFCDYCWLDMISLISLRSNQHE